jgi:hypothetical protein
MMKSKLVLATAATIAFVFGASGTASAGKPTDAQMGKTERMKQMNKYQKKMGTEKGNIGATMDTKGEKMKTGANQGSAAVEETATTPATKKHAGGEKGTDKMK